MIKFGIEHEFVFKNNSNEYVDFQNSDYSIFRDILDDLPFYKNDKKYFITKSTEKQPKRWYIEGFERYNNSGNVKYTIPKALEIRTTPHDNIDNLIDEFYDSYKILIRNVQRFGLQPLLTSYYPLLKKFDIKKRLSPYELKIRSKEELNIAINSMKSHGLHINISIDNASLRSLEYITAKINYYLPYIIPFCFSSPFAEGKLFRGLSYRNYIRAGSRNLVQIRKINNIPIIEIKAMGIPGELEILKDILLLFKSIIIDDSLNRHSAIQRNELLKRSAVYGFNDSEISSNSKAIIKSSKKIIFNGDTSFTRLKNMIDNRLTYSDIIISKYHGCHDLIESLSGLYNY